VEDRAGLECGEGRRSWWYMKKRRIRPLAVTESASNIATITGP
jgi:hypothetical protein